QPEPFPVRLQFSHLAVSDRDESVFGSDAEAEGAERRVVGDGRVGWARGPDGQVPGIAAGRRSATQHVYRAAAAADRRSLTSTDGAGANGVRTPALSGAEAAEYRRDPRDQ